MNDSRADEELVADYLAGDTTALAGIYDRYADKLYDTAAAMLNDRHEAADVMQDVFLLAAERLGQLRDAARLKPWLFAILRNQVFSRSKGRSRTRVVDFSAPESPEMAAPVDPRAEGEELAYTDLAEMVRSAAAGLDDRDQLVLEYSLRQGMTGADLADALGVSLEQSYVVVHRMRERVEKTLGALTVARMGRKECAELATILNGWDGTFSVLIRKRVARHLERCSTCERTKRRFAVAPLMGAAPALAAPPELRDRVLGAIARPGAAPKVPYGFTEPGGFPTPISNGRRGGTALWIAGVIAAALVLLGGGLAVALRDDGSVSTSADSDAGGVTVPASSSPDDARDPSVPTGATDPSESTDPSPTTSSNPATTSTMPSLSPAATVTTTVPSTTPIVTTLVPGSVVPPVVLPPADVPVVVPPVVVPPVIVTPPDAPATTSPSEPAVTDPPATEPPPPVLAPGLLTLSSAVVDLTTTNVGGVDLKNTGQQPLTWSIQGGALAPFSTAATSGSLEPGQSTSVQFSVDRNAAAEGANIRNLQVLSSAAGGGAVEVRATIERAPGVTITRPAPAYTCPPGEAPRIEANVSDESPLAGVRLSWTGPDAPGSVAMQFDGVWFAALGVPYVNGLWTYSVTATDSRGNSSVANGTTTVVCPQ